jgi:hypothetical protein
VIIRGHRLLSSTSIIAAPAIRDLIKVEFDAGKSSGATTFSHTVSGTNRYLIVQIALGNGADTISSVTYAGVSMTQLQRSASPSFYGAELWGLVNPALGANNVVITRGTGSTGIATGCTSFTNVDQTTPVKAGSGGGSTGTGVTTLNGPSQTTNIGGMVVESVGSNSVTPTGLTKQGWNDGGGDGGFYLYGTGSAQQSSYTIAAGNNALASIVINAVGFTGTGIQYTDSDTVPLQLTPSGTDTYQGTREIRPIVIVQSTKRMVNF